VTYTFPSQCLTYYNIFYSYFEEGNRGKEGKWKEKEKSQKGYFSYITNE